jgi:hypothetical protein
MITIETANIQNKFILNIRSFLRFSCIFWFTGWREKEGESSGSFSSSFYKEFCDYISYTGKQNSKDDTPNNDRP